MHLLPCAQRVRAACALRRDGVAPVSTSGLRHATSVRPLRATPTNEQPLPPEASGASITPPGNAEPAAAAALGIEGASTKLPVIYERFMKVSRERLVRSSGASSSVATPWHAGPGIAGAAASWCGCFAGGGIALPVRMPALLSANSARSGPAGAVGGGARWPALTPTNSATALSPPVARCTRHLAPTDGAAVLAGEP